MLLGIALGVAVVVSIDLANVSASRAFDLSTAVVAGKATHQIMGGPGGLDQAVYTDLKVSPIPVPIAPVLSDYAISPELGGSPLQLLGIDAFAEPPFRNFLIGRNGTSPTRAVDLVALLTQPGAVLISDRLARQNGISVGQVINLEVGGRRSSVHIAGLLLADDEVSQRALNGIILTDLSTAQELTGRLSTLDTIDIILPEGEMGEQLKSLISQKLSGRGFLQSVASRTGAVEQMTAAFRLNLTALSLLALVVGMFLIYNTMTFSVVQRRALFGILRCLGVTRMQVFGIVLSEAFIVSLAGSMLGLMLGIWIGRGTVRLVSQTINDLFFVMNVQPGQIAVESLVKGSLLGITVSLLSAIPPAWEASSVPPKAALSRSGLEVKTRSAIKLAVKVGFALIIFGGLTLLIPTRSLVLSFTSTLGIMIGFAMLVPAFTGVLMKHSSAILEKILGLLGRMATRNVEATLSRTAIAIMALMVAVSVIIGVSLMVKSFRFTVSTWLGETLQGDIYISAPSLTATTPTESVDPRVKEIAAKWPGVEKVYSLRAVMVSSPEGEVQIYATDNNAIGSERIFLAEDLRPDKMWESMLSGAVLVSEPFADRMRLPKHGGVLTLNTETGPRQFPVIGIFYDYSSVTGTVLMALPVYRKTWNDQAITAVQLRLAPGTRVDEVIEGLQQAFLPVQVLRVQANQILKREVLKVFDRTFLITGALQLIATVVAFIGILSALLSLELERQRDLGILRSIGMTVRQVRALIFVETGLMGAVSGLLAMPAGYVLALILVFIINKRSFGWTLQMNIDVVSFLQAFGIALLAALLAGIYPAIRIGRISPSEALRFE